MNPAMSVVIFTTLCGAAQGLVVTLAVLVLGGALDASNATVNSGLVLAGVMLLASLAASFLHLGRPERAWRAVMMWRTSWLSREVIVLPLFTATVGLWWLTQALGYFVPLLPVICVLVSVLLWYCTAKVYMCIRFLQEWAHPLTLINYTLIGLSSGLILSGALLALIGPQGVAVQVAPFALVITIVAWIARALSLRRNRTIRHASTLQSAIGVRARDIKQISMGMSAGSFNTREFFHPASRAVLKNIKWGFIVLGFAVPAVLVAWFLVSHDRSAWLIAFPLQYLGLLCERWFFFAQARHPQNLYYQVVS
jgi:DMSO reductase anchor subunit